MSTPNSRAMMFAGLTVLLFSVSAGLNSGGAGGFGFLLICFAGVLAGASLVAIGVRMADDDDPAPGVPAVLPVARAFPAFMRRNFAVVGLVMASCAVTAVSGGEAGAGQVLCFAMYALLLLGLSLIIVGIILGE